MSTGFEPSTKHRMINLADCNMNDVDLKEIIESIEKITNCQCFDDLTSIDLNGNAFRDREAIDRIFSLFATKFRQLKQLNVANSGIECAPKDQQRLKMPNLSAAITWYQYEESDDSEGEKDFVFALQDDESDDEEESLFDINADRDLSDDTADSFINDDGTEIFDDDATDGDDDKHLKVEYSLNIHSTKSYTL